MKKIFTLFLFALTSGVLAQNFTAYETNNAQTTLYTNLTNGSTLNVVSTVSTPSGNISTSFKVKLFNTSASTLTLSVKRRIVANNPPLLLNGAGNIPDTYFCFGFQCFPSNINSPGPADYCILGPAGTNTTACCNGTTNTCCTPTFTGSYDNSKENGTPFVIILDEGLTQGYYVVSYTLFDINNVSDSIMFYVKYNAILSVQENNNVLESVSNIYPNPATNMANVTVNLTRETPVKVQVYNSIGALVYSGNEQKSPGKNKVSVDCTLFNSGLYFMTLTAGDTKITKRLVINK